MKILVYLASLFIASICCGDSAFNWSVILSNELAQDEAIKVAVADLQTVGENFGIAFKVENGKKSAAALFVGDASRNPQTAKMIESGVFNLESLENDEGFQIITREVDGKTVMCVAGGSIRGDVNGLYWIWDRIRVYKSIPAINTIRIPDLQYRSTIAGSSKESMRNALRYGATWVVGDISTNNLIPWGVEPEDTKNKQNRDKVRELIEYAHSLHLKYLVFEDEFSYHPKLIEEFGATLSPNDPAFWDAAQAKYRRLLKALPEIDGIRFRTGESTRVGGNYRAFDVMHDGEFCNWSLAMRYRTWVKKMYNVIVGEFDKIMFQRTWVTSAHEQHSMAAVYKEIFTDDIPVRNLYMSPYLSTTDRYFHQPYNPTFNLTPHNMIVLLARLDYHSNANIATFPTFPGQYFQGGLKTILSGEFANVKGTDFGIGKIDDWNTDGVTCYTIWRLSWDHQEDLDDIARDFCSIHFGREPAEQLAEIYLMSPHAYKYGIYIEPVAHGDFRSLPHLRLTTFPAKGFPRLDHGKKHMEFLQKLFFRCQPWETETLLYLDHGLDAANSMVEKFKPAKHLVNDAEKANEFENSLLLTQRLIKSNNLYVKTFFNYFNYREKPTRENKSALAGSAEKLRLSMDQFLATPKCVYRLDGMDQLLKNVQLVLQDREKAEHLLATAPGDEEIDQLINEQQEKYKKLLQDYSDQAVKFLYWQGRVDGRDLIHIRDEKVEVEHLRYDDISEMSFEFFENLPNKPVTVFIKDIQARSFRPFVLEQPNEKNNYTATLYLSDYPEHGYSWWKFELYYIDRLPEELGLNPPWQE